MTDQWPPSPRLDEPWEKRAFSTSPGQFYLYVPGMESAATWPMNEAVIDRILADHDATLESKCHHRSDGKHAWIVDGSQAKCSACGQTKWVSR